MSLLLPILLASLLGSVHCAAMCGGFVCLYAGETRGWSAHLAYNGGRLASYMLAGAVAGLIGVAVNGAGVFVGIARLAAIISGALLVLWGSALALRALGVRLRSWDGPRITQRLLASVLGRLKGRSPVVRAGAIGLLSTLLPCGWLYAFVAVAGGTGRLTTSLLTMFVFWVGTLPAMLAVGYSLQRLTGSLRQRLPLVTALAVVVIGALSLFGRLHTNAALPAPPVALETSHGHGR
jgi:sulfite exporter TauE/SafE